MAKKVDYTRYGKIIKRQNGRVINADGVLIHSYGYYIPPVGESLNPVLQYEVGKEVEVDKDGRYRNLLKPEENNNPARYTGITLNYVFGNRAEELAVFVDSDKKAYFINAKFFAHIDSPKNLLKREDITITSKNKQQIIFEVEGSRFGVLKVLEREHKLMGAIADAVKAFAPVR